jgi:ABC-2 type transport system ATP-binding protein
MINSLAIDARNLSKSFGSKLVVDDISIQINSGEIFGFLGANGSGKTTTIRMLCGLLTPDFAQGHCLGFDLITESRLIKKKVGYMPQRFSLYPDLSVYENLQFVSQLYLMLDATTQIEKIAEQLKLQDKMHQPAGELSGGWKQRLSFAASLIHEPELLLLDEPTAGIDPLARRDFWDLIHELSESGVTTLISTHYMDEAQRCDRLAYLSLGKLLVSGSIDDVISATQIQTFRLVGHLSSQLLKELKNLNGVLQAAWFGDSIHVCTNRSEEILPHLNSLSAAYSFKFNLIEPSLEDAFITLGAHQC